MSILGGIYGVLLGGYGLSRYLDRPLVGLSVGLSVGAAIVIAAGLFNAWRAAVRARDG